MNASRGRETLRLAVYLTIMLCSKTPLGSARRMPVDGHEGADRRNERKTRNNNTNCEAAGNWSFASASVAPFPWNFLSAHSQVLLQTWGTRPDIGQTRPLSFCIFFPAIANVLIRAQSGGALALHVEECAAVQLTCTVGIHSANSLGAQRNAAMESDATVLKSSFFLWEFQVSCAG